MRTLRNTTKSPLLRNLSSSGGLDELIMRGTRDLGQTVAPFPSGRQSMTPFPKGAQDLPTSEATVLGMPIPAFQLLMGEMAQAIMGPHQEAPGAMMGKFLSQQAERSIMSEAMLAVSKGETPSNLGLLSPEQQLAMRQLELGQREQVFSEMERRQKLLQGVEKLGIDRATKDILMKQTLYNLSDESQRRELELVEARGAPTRAYYEGATKRFEMEQEIRRDELRQRGWESIYNSTLQETLDPALARRAADIIYPRPGETVPLDVDRFFPPDDKEERVVPEEISVPTGGPGGAAERLLDRSFERLPFYKKLAEPTAKAATREELERQKAAAPARARGRFEPEFLPGEGAEAKTYEENLSRFTELFKNPTRTPDEDRELELLQNRLKETPGFGRFLLLLRAETGISGIRRSLRGALGL